jgi:hypothetical protein
MKKLLIILLFLPIWVLSQPFHVDTTPTYRVMVVDDNFEIIKEMNDEMKISMCEVGGIMIKWSDIKRDTIDLKYNIESPDIIRIAKVDSIMLLYSALGLFEFQRQKYLNNQISLFEYRVALEQLKITASGLPIDEYVNYILQKMAIINTKQSKFIE